MEAHELLLSLKVAVEGPFWRRRSRFAAKVFVNALDNGAFPVAESSGPSGRYPKMWDLPSWQAILKRPDVASAVFSMCAFGLGPPDEPSAFYRHYTRVVFPSHGPLAQLLHRVCPGISSNHRHVPLKGCRPGVTVTRCTEAGAYPADFIKQIVQTLQASLTVLSAGGGMGGHHRVEQEVRSTGGGSTPPPMRRCRKETTPTGKVPVVMRAQGRRPMSGRTRRMGRLRTTMSGRTGRTRSVWTMRVATLEDSEPQRGLQTRWRNLSAPHLSLARKRRRQ